jgi:chromosome segregation ATPase
LLQRIHFRYVGCLIVIIWPLLIVGPLQTKLAVLQERNINLQQSIDGLTQDCSSKQAELKCVFAEFDKKIEKHEAASKQLLKVETKRADAAEREAAAARRQVDEERRVNGEFKKRIGVMEEERKQLEEEGRRMVVDAEGVKDEQVGVLKEKVVELEKIIGELVEKGNTLKERYEKNSLVSPGLSGSLRDSVLKYTIYVGG